MRGTPDCASRLEPIQTLLQASLLCNNPEAKMKPTDIPQTFGS